MTVPLQVLRQRSDGARVYYDLSHVRGVIEAGGRGLALEDGVEVEAGQARLRNVPANAVQGGDFVVAMGQVYRVEGTVPVPPWGVEAAVDLRTTPKTDFLVATVEVDRSGNPVLDSGGNPVVGFVKRDFAA